MSTRPTTERLEFEARLLGAIGQPVVATDVEFRVIYWNRGAELFLGYRAEEMLGRDLIEAVSVETSQDRLDRLAKDLAGGDEVVDDFIVHKRDGTAASVFVLVTPMLDDDSNLIGTVLVATDISDRTASRATLARLSAIVESSCDAIIGLDLSGLVTSWNEGARQLFGYDADEILGHSVASLTSGAAADVAKMLEGLAIGAAVDMVPLVSRHGVGAEAVIESTVYPVRLQGGDLVGAAVVSRDVTSRNALEQMAEEEHRRLEEAQRVAQVGSFEFNVRTGESKWSRELRRLMGVPREEPPDYRSFVSRIHPEDSEQFLEDIRTWIAGRDQYFESEFRVVLPEPHTVRWLSARVEAFRDAEGSVSTMVGSVRDLTEQRANTRARRRAEEQFAAAFDLGGVGMLVTDLDRRILRANTAFCQQIGRPLDEVVGRTPNEFAHPSEPDEPASASADRAARAGGGHLDLERRFLHADGSVVHTEVHLSVLRNEDDEPEYFFFQVVDITGRKRVEGELQRLAMHDPLTGLPNRYLLQDRLATALARSKRVHAHGVVAVLFVDIDHFKLVNDSLGHSTGDSLLVQLAGRLVKESRSGDTVARFGGDEFVMVCEDVTDAAEAARIGERVLKLFDEPFLVAKQQLYITVSTGIVVAAPEATTVTLLRDADAAMYQAKDGGRARAEMFDETLRHRAARRLDVEMMLRRALERGELRITYQPIVSIPADRPVGVEALLRWEHPERGTLSPTEFIPAAEETGLIVPIGAWVLEEALAQLAIWRRQLPGASGLYVAVNLSPRQLLSGDLLARCRDATTGQDLPTDALCLEITEGTVMRDVDVSIPILRKLSESGIKIAVDDFGTGYSSLAYLKRLPVSTLKIDRSFVDGLPYDVDDSAIVRAIVSLGHALSLELCAEGVETPAQRAELVGLGCQLGQGYLWAPSMQADAFAEWFGRRLKGTSGSSFAPL